MRVLGVGSVLPGRAFNSIQLRLKRGLGLEGDFLIIPLAASLTKMLHLIVIASGLPLEQLSVWVLFQLGADGIMVQHNHVLATGTGTVATTQNIVLVDQVGAFLSALVGLILRQKLVLHFN